MRRLAVPATSNYLENGRYYHGFRRGMYMYPCDEVSRPCAALPRPTDCVCACVQQEKDRMDIYHKLFSVARRDQLHQAPIPQRWEPRILDIGCGTGIWGIDMAE